jgi:hypothetical protein
VLRNDSSERPSASRSTFLLFFSLIPETLPAGTAQLPVPHGLSADAKADLTQISEGLARINKHEANSTQILKQLGCLAFCFSDATFFMLETDLVYIYQ